MQTVVCDRVPTERGIVMGWWKDKLAGLDDVGYDELAENLYEVLVLDGGPSTPQEGQEQRLNAVSLDIPADKVKRFAEKRILTYEALLVLTVNVVTQDQTEQLQQNLGDAVLHPLTMEIETQIQKMWRERGIDVHDVSTFCFKELDDFFDEPFKWGREWLSEFYSDDDMPRRHYIAWTDQWRSDFEVMRTVVEDFA
jgi:hypothetical protein